MKPGFALSLSFDGISLLHRAAGGWRMVGEVPLNAPDLGAALAELRAGAERLDPGNLACKLIIPNEQIRYLSVDTGSVSEDARLEQVRKALDGATPYAVSELAFDMSQDGATTHVAAVALETLDEAESFAREHAFNPVSFVAVPDDQPYLGEPYFGTARQVPDLTVEPDGVAVVVIGPAEFPPEEPVSAPAPEPAPSGFATRRARPAAAPEPDAAAVDAPSAAPDAGPASPAKAQAVPGPAVTQPSIPVAPDPAAQVPPEPAERTEPPRVQPRRVPGPAAPSNSPLASDLDPEDETGRMTVFGARPNGQVGGKPRFLALALTAGLLVFLLILAAWAAIGSDFRLFGRDPAPLARDVEQGERPDLPAPRQADDAGPDLPSQVPSGISGEAAPDLASAEPADPAGPDLSATDTAVLDALYSPADATDGGPEDEQDADETLLPQDLEPDPRPVEDSARYAATGIWHRAPEQPVTPGVIGLNDLYTASIDRTDLSQDPVALPPVAGLQTDAPVATVSTPVAPDTMIRLNAQGLVEPSPEGTLNPDGILIYQGRPPVVPPVAERADPVEPEANATRERLAGLRPRLRPDNLVEQSERSQLGGRSRAELAGLRPRLRPDNLAPEPDQPQETDGPATAQAVAASVKPRPRPANFAETVNRVKLAASSTAGISTVAPQATASVAPKTVTPKIPTTASVARQATVKNTLNLRKVNLIGVYGSPSDRRALVRLPSGRYKKVKIGDSVDGGRVVAIGDSELRYQKGGRNVTLKMPKG